MPSIVENALNTGTRFPTRAGTTRFHDTVNNIRVITNSETGRVVTVIRGGALMVSKRLERAKSLHDAIHNILIEQWDPIGVGGIPEAQDEYASYVPQIYRLLISRKPLHEVFEYLWWLETEHMGLRGHRQKTEQIAETLFKLAQE